MHDGWHSAHIRCLLVVVRISDNSPYGVWEGGKEEAPMQPKQR